jgi:hypothetical protein
MNLRKSLIIVSILTIYTNLALSQTVEMPNYALKSHETLEIKKIEFSAKGTVFSMSIENRIEGGIFCADKNIFLVYPDGTRVRLTSSNGIPVCPDSYKFKTIGEKLDFILSFPALKKGTQSVDLVEDCTENCFSFYGIALDNDLNRKIEEAFVLAESKEPANAMVSFIKIAEDTRNKNSGINGLLYINIIKLAQETGNTVKAAEWYNKLKSSGVPRVPQYIKYLNDQGIKY